MGKVFNQSPAHQDNLPSLKDCKSLHRHMFFCELEYPTEYYISFKKCFDVSVL